MPVTDKTPPQPAQRPYPAPALIVHGEVRTLTLGKSGQQLDQDGGGSFTPPTPDDSQSS
ncbi:MAG: lasso RiPP family leader peptide-containing protein [Anaerolineales bacterium]|nr:lasso RiPP family leader peptide-containing protein [Anaerolineales bacterium]